MNLNDLKIGTKLRLGMGVIMLLTALLAAMAWMQMEQLWSQTKGSYEHPFKVRQALSDMQNQILSMHLKTKDLCMVESDREREAIVQEMDIREADVHRQFATLYESYLGPLSDIESAEQAFIEWKAIREETRRLLREGKLAEAVARSRPTGACGLHIEKMLGEIKEISDFSRKRAIQFYRESEQGHAAISRRLLGMAAIILLFAMAVIGLLLKWIRTPLAELTAVTEQFRHGKLDVRSGYRSANEFGKLAASFNTMADAIQTEMTISRKVSQIEDVMLREEELHAFCWELLRALIEHSGSQVGAVYVLNEAGTVFEHFESIGLGAGGRAVFSATQREGELGAVLATRRIQRIVDIPPETRFVFAASSGDFIPREILTIPVLSGRTVVAVISLASVRAYDEPAIRLVNDIWSVLTARMNGVRSFKKIHDLAERLERQNHELEAQANELTEQNTELEMQKRQLDEANRLKSAFLSNMSHELRTPLNSVIALSGVLNRRLANAIPAEEYGYLEIIERNGRNLLSLINAILDLSRIEAGREEINVSRFSVRELADEIVAMLEPQALEKGVALSSLVGGDLPPLTSDSDKFRHILQNLVGNAVKFTEQGKVTITAEVSGDRFLIAVADTGIGITAAQLPHIFDEFRQGDDSTSRKYGGTGLGLAIAKKFALLLGGDISVESAPGQGSTFRLRLPLAAELPGAGLAAETGGQAAERGAGALPAPSGQGQNILVVEDNEPAVIQLRDILEFAGYRVQVARNGKQALDRIGQTMPAAMILDLMMPEVDGFQVLKTLRASAPAEQLPVLILTAKHVTREELSFLKGNHIHQLIQKGDIDRDGLLAAVARMVAPLHATPAPSRVAGPPHRRRPSRPGKPLILIVEDNPDNLRTAKALLGDRYRIIEAENGLTALEQARRHKPDLILTDIALPVLDGFAELAAIREDQYLRDIPVIAITASAMKGDREEILARGFDGYISKPIAHELLMKTLAEFLVREP